MLALTGGEGRTSSGDFGSGALIEAESARVFRRINCQTAIEVFPPMVDAALLSRVKTMSPADRLELIRAVWETLTPADAPVTDEEKALLDTRLSDLENNPEDQSPWSEVQARLRHQLP